jgi:hypothetical protein
MHAWDRRNKTWADCVCVAEHSRRHALPRQALSLKAMARSRRAGPKRDSRLIAYRPILTLVNANSICPVIIGLIFLIVGIGSWSGKVPVRWVTKAYFDRQNEIFAIALGLLFVAVGLANAR